MIRNWKSADFEFELDGIDKDKTPEVTSLTLRLSANQIQSLISSLAPEDATSIVFEAMASDPKLNDAMVKQFEEWKDQK